MSDWSTQRVEQLAPDGAAIKAAQGVAKPGRWSAVGRDESLIWGECQGSGSRPYQVRVDLSDAANKCSCPSRKQPCKHALGLLLMLAAGNPFPACAPPAFVVEWQTARARRAGPAARAADPAAAVPDTELAARRVARRETRITEGLALLDTWLHDVLEQGLATVRGQPEGFWAQTAARLVDCQAPGLARRVRELADIAASGPDAHERLLIGLGRLRLLVDAYRRLARLPADLAAEVRTLVGWNQPREALLAREGIRGHWQVVARQLDTEEQLRVQRTWLVCGGQVAELLDFAPRGQPLAQSLSVGQCLDAELVYYDGVPLRRALIRHLHASLPLVGTLPSPLGIAQIQQRFGAQLAANPWLERIGCVLGPVTPRVRSGRFELVDGQGRGMRLPPRFKHAWHLIAVSQGAPCVLFGEWDGHCFAALAVERAGVLYSLEQVEGAALLSRVV